MLLRTREHINYASILAVYDRILATLQIYTSGCNKPVSFPLQPSLKPRTRCTKLPLLFSWGSNKILCDGLYCKRGHVSFMTSEFYGDTYLYIFVIYFIVNICTTALFTYICEWRSKLKLELFLSFHSSR